MEKGSSSPEKPGADGSRPSTTILVVDDDKLVLELVRVRLVRDGYDVLTADGGREGIELAAEHRPDLAIVDLMMPEVSGWEVIEQLHSNAATQDVPVIILTARTANEDMLRGLALGAGDYVKKPFSPRELSDRVRSMLESEREPSAAPAPAFDPTRLTHEQLRNLNDRLVHVTSELETALAQRQLLLAQLAQVQEIERRRIAELIHDDPLQAILAAELQLQALAGELTDEQQVKRVDDARTGVLAAGRRLRALVFNLEPSDVVEAGLAAGLQADFDYRRDQGWDCKLTVRDTTRREMSSDLRILLYRFTQELVTNSQKHARASHVDIEIGEREGGFFVRVGDDGVGCLPEEALLGRPGHLGLPELRDRVEAAGGTLGLTSAPGHGTVADVWVPDAITVGAIVDGSRAAIGKASSSAS